MVESLTSYPDFSGGEVSPELYGRFDLQTFYKGARRVQNFIPYSVGMARYRPGTVFVAKTRLGRVARLEEFKISESVSYVLEFTDLVLRLHRAGGQVRFAAQSITGVTRANPAVVTYSGADNFSNGDSVFIDDVVGMTELNGNEYIVANVNTGANTFELQGTDSSAFTAYSSGGNIEKVFELTTPYTDDDIFNLSFEQFSSSVMYIANENYNPKKLEFTSATSWTLTNHSPVRKTFDPSQIITNITQANPAVVTYSGSDNFTNGDIVKITGVVGMTEVNNGVDERYTVAGVNTAANTFQLQGIDSSGFNAYSSGGLIQKEVSGAAPFLSSGEYPRAVGSYEERLIYAGSDNKPQTIYLSRSANPDDFSLGTEVDQGIEYVVAGDVGRVNWLRGTERFLGVGCVSDVLQATGGIDGVITPDSISIRRSNAPGVANIQPIGQGTQIFFVQGNELTLRSFEFDFQRDSYIPVDRNQVADHITKSGMKQISYQIGRPNILWAVRNDGILIGMTVEEQEGISGWHRHDTGGGSDTFVSVAPESRSTQYKRLWFCVKRGSEHFIEYLSDYVIYPRREDYVSSLLSSAKSGDDDTFANLLFEKQKEYIHVDSALSYYGDATGSSASATLTPGATTGTGVTFTASASVFDSSMVDRELWRKSVTGAETGRAKITGYTSATVVTCDILEDFDSVSAIPAGEWYLTTDSVTGLDHLEGETVTVVADGGQHGDETVSSGTITLDRQSSVVHVGKGYNGYLQTNNLEVGTQLGTSQTRRKVVTGFGIRMLDSLFVKYGTTYYTLEQLSMRTSFMRMDRPPELFTGDRKVTYTNNTNDLSDAGWSREKTAIVVQDRPFPCNIQLVVPYVEVS